jgi:hypothetical protein
MEKKRHHHYVWRYYLRPWSSNERIACSRGGEFFEPNLMGVGQKRDFNKLKDLNPKELAFIKEFAIDRSPPALQDSHLDLLKNFTFVFKFKKFVETIGIKDPEANKTVEALIHNLEEDLHTGIESTAIKYLASILGEDVGFYDTEDGCMEFILFLCVQHQRTEKIKKSVLKATGNLLDIKFENVWNVLRHIFAINIAWNLFVARKVFRMILLKNESSKEFITGDQPVVNTRANIGAGKTPPSEIELYYPVSPRLAILISEREELKGARLKLLAERDVISYNNMIVNNSDTQIYATSFSVLEEYRDLQKMKA